MRRLVFAMYKTKYYVGYLPDIKFYNKIGQYFFLDSDTEHALEYDKNCKIRTIFAVLGVGI